VPQLIAIFINILTPVFALVLTGYFVGPVLAALIALEHKLVPDFVTTAVLFSTLLSAVTLTIVLALV